MDMCCSYNLGQIRWWRDETFLFSCKQITKIDKQRRIHSKFVIFFGVSRNGCLNNKIRFFRPILPCQRLSIIYLCLLELAWAGSLNFWLTKIWKVFSDTLKQVKIRKRNWTKNDQWQQLKCWIKKWNTFNCSVSNNNK